MIDFPDPGKEAEFIRRRARDFDQPPAPVRLGGPEGPTPVVVMRWAWMQPLVEDYETERPAAYQAPAEVVAQIEAHGNPLRQLAAALIDAADQADRDGFVPLGLNLETRYYPCNNMLLYRDRPHTAMVAVTARGVRREWLDRNGVTREAEVLP